MSYSAWRRRRSCPTSGRSAIEPASSSGRGAVSRERAPSIRWRMGDSVTSRTASRAAPSSGCGSGTSPASSSAIRTSSISADWASSSRSTSGASPASAPTGATADGATADGATANGASTADAGALAPSTISAAWMAVARAEAPSAIRRRVQFIGVGDGNPCRPCLPGQVRSGPGGRRPGLAMARTHDAPAKARGLETGAVVRRVTGGAGGGRWVADDVARRVDGVEARGSMAGLALHAAPAPGGGHVARTAGTLPPRDVAGDAVEVVLAASLLERLVGPRVRGALPGGEGGLVAVPAVAGSAPGHLVHADEGGGGG